MSAEYFPVRWAGRLAVLSMPAEVDLTNAAALLGRILTVLDRQPATVIVDMTATTFCDSAGVNTLVRAHQRAASVQAELRLVAPGRAVRRILTVTGLDRLISVYPSLAASLAAGRPAAGASGAGGLGNGPAPPGPAAQPSDPPVPDGA